MTKPHWLTDVAKVLCADTDDLRQLAKIGGADPRTAYIGTRLDGADLSGQDLRGMLFTDLDLARVNHDQATQIDPDQLNRPPAESVPTAVILVLSNLVTPDQAARQIASKAALVLGPKDLDLFKKNVDKGVSGIVVVLEAELDMLSVALAVNRDMGDRSRDLILVMQGRLSQEQTSLWWKTIGRQQTLFCADPAMARYAYGQGLSSDTRHLLRTLSYQGTVVREQIGPRSVYLRAVGRGPDPVMDAAAQIFDRIWREDLQAYQLGVFLTSNLKKLRTEGAGWLLDTQFIVVATAARATTIEAFIDLDHAGPVQIDYMDHAVQAASRFAPGRNSRGPIEYRGLDYGALAMLQAMGVEPGRRFQSPGYDNVRHFNFHEVRSLIFNPKADVNWVATRLLDVGELWVTARDVVAAGVGEISTWNLVAAQLRRFIPTGMGAGRQTYLELIIRAGLPNYTGNRSELLSVLESDIVIRVENFETDVGIARFEAILAPRGAPRDRHDFRVDVAIDGAGVQLIAVDGA